MDKKPTSEIPRIFPLTTFKAKIGLTENERNKLIKELYKKKEVSKNFNYFIK